MEFAFVVVHSDDEVMAFMDISQVNLGYVLVIPKVHATYMSELDEEIGAHLFKIEIDFQYRLLQHIGASSFPVKH